MILTPRQTNRPVNKVKPIIQVKEKKNHTTNTNPKKVTIDAGLVIKRQEELNHARPAIPIFNAILAHINIIILLVYGTVNDFLRIFCSPNIDEPQPPKDTQKFTPLYQSFESFFTRNMYIRIRHCWNKPIAGVPGRKVALLERKPRDKRWFWKFDHTGKIEEPKLNFSSYNYREYIFIHLYRFRRLPFRPPPT